MKLNGLSNNLAGNDKSLSNSYLSHIVELLRQEVANLTARESELEAITTEHIESKFIFWSRTIANHADCVFTVFLNKKLFKVIQQICFDCVLDFCYCHFFCYLKCCHKLPLSALTWAVVLSLPYLYIIPESD